MLVFVNYVHFSKNPEIVLLTSYLKFDNNISITRQQTSNWQTHLTY